MRAALSVSVLLIVGCGGSGGGDKISVTTEASVPRVNLHGIWAGTLFFLDGNTADLTGLTHDNNLYLTDTNFNYQGTFGTNDTGALEGNGTVHHVTGEIYTTFTIEGVGTEQSTISLGPINGLNGRVALVFDTIYNNGSDLAFLEGLYLGSPFDDYVVSIGVSGAGAILGGDSNGCEISGEFSIIDSDVNVYDVSYAVSSCAQASTGQGFAFINDVSGRLNIVLSSAAEMLFFPFDRI